MQSVMELPDNAIVIEAGGGTGIMTREAMNTKRDARIYMCDFNPAMAEHAVAKGIPREHLAVGPKIGDIQNLHIGSRKAKDGEVDLIFSHSVLWNLVDPETFFSEASRVLKKDGILSVSTIRSGTQGITSYFVQSIRDGFKSAVDMRIITLDAANTFADQNAIAVANMEEPGSPVKSTLSPDRIRQIADKYGFEVRDISDCYVVATPNGPKPFFIQFKLKKVS